MLEAAHRSQSSTLLAASLLAIMSVVQALNIAAVSDAGHNASAAPIAGTPALPVELQQAAEPAAQGRAKRSLRRQNKGKQPLQQPMMVQSNASVKSSTAGIRPASVADSETGYYLTPMELARIQTIECLQMKIKDPFLNCTEENIGYYSDYQLNAANYPSWKDPQCRSNDEFFCDPDRILTDDERLKITGLLKKLRSQSIALCGDRDPIDRWHYQPFYVGVALAKDWPMHLSDAETLQLFGRMLAARWNMSYPWDGAPLPFSRCATEGMLIVLPEQKQVFLSTPSCQFVCSSRGGPEVMTAAMVALNSRGVAAAITAGLKEIYTIVNSTTPETSNLVPSPQLDNWWDESATIRLAGPARPMSKDWQLASWNFALRALYAISVVVMAASIVVAILVCLLAPGLISKITKSNV